MLWWMAIKVAAAVKSCRIAGDNATSYSLGFGFIEYFSAESTAKGLHLNEHQVDDKWATHRDQKWQYMTQIYTSESCQRHITWAGWTFSAYGNIINWNILFDEVERKSCGIACLVCIWLHSPNQQYQWHTNVPQFSLKKWCIEGIPFVFLQKFIDKLWENLCNFRFESLSELCVNDMMWNRCDADERCVQRYC